MIVPLAHRSLLGLVEWVGIKLLYSTTGPVTRACVKMSSSISKILALRLCYSFAFLYRPLQNNDV